MRNGPAFPTALPHNFPHSKLKREPNPPQIHVEWANENNAPALALSSYVAYNQISGRQRAGQRVKMQ